jgi:hemolysin III
MLHSTSQSKTVDAAHAGHARGVRARSDATQSIPGAGGRPMWLSRWICAVPSGERMNVTTHAGGLAIFLVLGCWLIVRSSALDSLALTLSASAFIGTVLATYAASVAYHCSTSEARKPMLRILDHCAIYLLIAGTYTPFAVALGGAWGIFLLASIWPAALIGMVLKILRPPGGRWMSSAIYLALGWVGVAAAEACLDRFSPFTIAWIVAGGLAYTAGTPFYLMSRVPGMHSLWHGFVMVGTACHFVAVASLVVLPLRALG